MSTSQRSGDVEFGWRAVTGDTVGRFRPSHVDFTNFQAAAFPVAARGQGGDDYAQPARPQEPSDLRILRRATRHLSRPRPCGRRQDRGRDRRRRQLLFRGRCARDHRTAGGDATPGRHGRPPRLHADDRRSGQGHARLPAADRSRSSETSSSSSTRRKATTWSYSPPKLSMSSAFVARDAAR